MSAAQQGNSEQATVEVSVQGKNYNLPAGQSLQEALTSLGLIPPDGEISGVALALNQEVVPAGEWTQRKISDGDRIQLFQAIAGG